jgi:hypothetical protein
MNGKSIVMAMLVTGMFFAPMVFAEMAPKDIAVQCKNEAMENEIPADELRQYVNECLAEYGIESADTDNATSELLPSDDSDTKSPDSES